MRAARRDPVPIKRRLLVVLGLFLAGCAADDAPRAPAESGAAALIPPVSELPGWTAAEDTTEYDAETLYEYLNGGAPAYLDFGFERLAHVRFALGGDDMNSLTVDVYDMGAKLGAFGIYSSVRPRDIEQRDWGAGGYRIGETAAAWKGRFYVHAVADEDSPVLTEAMESLVAGMVAAAPGDSSEPEIVQRLPKAGLIPHSARFVAKDLFGHVFLPGGLLAAYECGTEECTVFLCDVGNPDAAEGALTRLREYERLHGEVLERDLGMGTDGFLVEDPGLGPGIVTRFDGFVAGVWGGSTPERREDLLAALSGGR